MLNAEERRAVALEHALKFLKILHLHPDNTDTLTTTDAINLAKKFDNYILYGKSLDDK